MAVYTETLNLDGNLSSEVKKASADVNALSKGLGAAESMLSKANALDGKGIAKATGEISKFQNAIETVPQSLSAASEGAEGLVKSLSAAASMAASAIAAIGAAVVAVVATFATFIAWGVKMALTASDAKGDMILLFDVLGEGAVTGEETIAMLDRLGASTGKTRNELAPLAQAFATMGVTGVEQLERLTLAAVSAETLAKGGGKAFEDLWKKVNLASETGQALKIPIKGLGSLASMGLKVDDVASRMGLSASELAKQLGAGTANAKKFGDALSQALVEKGADPVADAAKDIEATWNRAKESVAKFFEDIDVGPFLAEVKSLFGILDQANPSGQALKAGIGAFFQKTLDVLTTLVPKVKSMFLDLIIYGLQAYIAIRPLFQQLEDFSKTEEAAQAIGWLSDTLKATAIVLGVLVASVAALIVFLGAIIAVVAAVGQQIQKFSTDAIVALAKFALTGHMAAQDFVQGLINGISQGGAQVIAAVKGLASSAATSFRARLGIRSPSTVMAGAGINMGEGVAVGLEKSEGRVEDASAGMAATAVTAVASTSAASPVASAGASTSAASPVASAGASSGRSGGGITVNVESGAIVIQGGSGEGLAELTEQAIAVIFERVALQQAAA